MTDSPPPDDGDHRYGAPSHPISEAVRPLVWNAIGLRDMFGPLTAERDAALAQAEADAGALAGPRRVVVPLRPARRRGHAAPPARHTDHVHAHVAQQIADELHVRTPQMLHLALNAAFDAFTAQLLRACYKLRPEVLRESDRTITYADAERLDNDGLRGLFVERTVADVLHRSRQEQLKHLYRIGRLDESRLRPLAEQFLEISERRNLYAHTGGRVSQLYLDKCRDANVPSQRAPGEQITNDAGYFDAACRTTALLGVLLAQGLWRHLGGKRHAQAADEDLHELTYVLLVRQEWELAEHLLREAVETTVDVRLRLYARVNLAQALKWQGRAGDCRTVLNAEHWATREIAFQLAEAVLTDQTDLAGDLMREAAGSGDVDRSAFDHWPLFREFRGTEQFQAAYADRYGEPCPTAGPQLSLAFPSAAGPA